MEENKNKMKTIKRNGDIVPFDKEKIVIAVTKAMKHGSGIYSKEVAEKVATDIESELLNNNVKEVTIHTIEEMVFEHLVKEDFATTAREYEAFRAVRQYQRENNTTDDTILSIVSKRNQEIMSENSNKDAFINSTQRDLLAGEISKDIAMRKIIPTHLVQAHKNASIHIHDMDYILQPMTNCCLINIGDMLQNGTVINKKQIKQPNSFQVACTVMTQIIAQIASNQYGLTKNHMTDCRTLKIA